MHPCARSVRPARSKYYVLRLEGQELCALTMVLQLVGKHASSGMLDVLRALAPGFWDRFRPIHEYAHACEPELADRVHAITANPDGELARLDRQQAIDDLLGSIGDSQH